MNEEVNPLVPIEVNQGRWTLKLIVAKPVDFELQFDGTTCYFGKLKVVNNDQRLPLDGIDWRFRHKKNRLEQWCQLHHSHTLSLNLNYSFVEGALVIEYLARNTVPARLDIGHVIHQDCDGCPPALAQWQHQLHGLPSHPFHQVAKTDLYREAFCARQWLVLENVRDTDETLS